MKRYEYATVRYDVEDNYANYLDPLGRDGWLVVASFLVPNTTFVEFVLAREVT